MLANNSIRPGSGNNSAGISIFSMVVMEPEHAPTILKHVLLIILGIQYLIDTLILREKSSLKIKNSSQNSHTRENCVEIIL